IRAGARLRAEELRSALALLIIAIAVRLFFEMVLTPSELFSVVTSLGRTAGGPARRVKPHGAGGAKRGNDADAYGRRASLAPRRRRTGEKRERRDVVPGRAATAR